jgi:hypothetical protein
MKRRCRKKEYAAPTLAEMQAMLDAMDEAEPPAQASRIPRTPALFADRPKCVLASAI